MTDQTEKFLSLVGNYRLDPADAPAFAKIACQCVAQTLNKPGCLYFTIAEDIAEPGLFHLSEGWSDRETLDAHLASADFEKILEQASKLRILDRQAFISDACGRTPLF